jgi:four helix bundle protein
MATVKRFEELLCWQRSRELVKEVYAALCDVKDRGFKDQIQRASVSVMSNIAEGFESGTKQGFLNYLYIAKGSAGEVRSQLYVAYDVGYIDVEKFKGLKFKAEECSRLVSSFIKSLKGSEMAGLQYKREQTKSQKSAEEFKKYVHEMLPEHLRID